MLLKKKMPDHITNDIELSSDDSISKACDEENSGEENSNKKNSHEENSHEQN